ncbi:MAG: hypothetical protein ACRD0F_03400 [Acidimicrobiales bacterium]
MTAAQAYRTSAEEKCASLKDMTFASHQVAAELPIETITTFVIRHGTR